MIAYIDLSILVFIFIMICSTFYSLLVYEKVVISFYYKINHFFLNLIFYLINLYLIPYCYFLFYIIYLLVILIRKKELLYNALLYLFFYIINIAFMFFLGGSFLYQGILLINVPYSSLYALIMPIVILIVSIIYKNLFKRLQKSHFILPAILYFNNDKYKLKTFYDSGNNLMYNNLPVIIKKKKIDVSNEKFEIILVKTINELDSFYKIYRARLKIKRHIIDCYFILSDDLNFIYNTNALLNINIKL